MSDTPLTDKVTGECSLLHRKYQFFKMRGHAMNLERKLSASEGIVMNLLYSMDSIRDRTDEELMEAFMDFDAEPVVRDTAKAILDAREYLKILPTPHP